MNTNNIISLNILTPSEIARRIASRVKARRLELDLTQEGMAMRSGISFATYRRFEQSGEVSLKVLLQIAFALDALPEFDALFSQRKYKSLDDVINGTKSLRKRGRKNG